MTESTTAVDTAAVPTKKNHPADGGVDAELVGRLVEQARAAGLQLTGEGGLPQQLTKRVVHQDWYGVPVPDGSRCRVTSHG